MPKISVVKSIDSDTEIIPSENKNKILYKWDKYSGFKNCPIITKN